jgi:hypothetical protein
MQAGFALWDGMEKRATKRYNFETNFRQGSYRAGADAAQKFAKSLPVFSVFGFFVASIMQYLTTF